MPQFPPRPAPRAAARPPPRPPGPGRRGRPSRTVISQDALAGHPERLGAPRRARASAASRRRRRPRRAGSGRSRSPRRPSYGPAARGPGTSTTPIRRPEGSTSGAKPSSIEIPRAPLLLQPVGLHAGERTDERGLAVVDVARGPEGRGAAGHAAPSATRTAVAAARRPPRRTSVRTSSSSRAVGDAPNSRVARTQPRRAAGVGGRPGERAPRRPRGPAAAARRHPRRPALNDLPPVSRPARPPAPALHSPPARGASPATGTSGSARSVAGQPERRPSAASESLSIRSARASDAPGTRDCVGPADDQPRLRPAEQLVAGAAGERPPAATERRRGGSSARSGSERTRADVVDHRARRGAHSASTSTSSTNPTVRKLDGGPQQRAVGRRARARVADRVRFVVPTSTRRAPAWATTSGIRKPPPISTSWPRETTSSRRAPVPRPRAARPRRSCSRRSPPPRR